MQVPLDITFQNSEPSEAIRSEVEKRSDCRAGVDRDTGHALIGDIVCRAEG